jgi:SAM-dependent methyltransferase
MPSAKPGSVADPTPEGTTAGLRRVLHVGCGPRRAEKLHPLFRGDDWHELRLDIDPAVQPDIVASVTHLEGLAPSSFDAVWSSHNLEHLYEHEVQAALSEVVRVLKRDGFALFTTPDLVRVAAEIAAGRLEDVLYVSHAGPIAPVDVLFGLRRAVARGNGFMAHRTGFDAARLGRFLIEEGFAEARVWQGDRFDLWGLGLMPEATLTSVGLAQAIP